MESMSEVPLSSPYRSTPDAPVSEDERNRLNARINAAFTEGRIDADDYSDRLDRLYAAQRMGDLLPVVTGLPPLATHTSPAIVADGGSGPPGELAPARSGTNLSLVAAAGFGGVVLLLVLLLVVLL
jgi:Domain of unknown function (DUF1707)